MSPRPFRTTTRLARRVGRRRYRLGSVLTAVALTGVLLTWGQQAIDDAVDADTPTAPTGGAVVARVVDGDGAVLVDGRTIRYNAVDTPEYRSAPGRASAECVNPDAAGRAEERNRQLVEGETVTVVDTGRRSWDRVIADLVLPDGTNVSEVLIVEGLGVRYDRDAVDACPAGAR